MIEIERKFLVASDAYKTEARSKTRVIQGYLNSNQQRAVRVRIKDDKGYITIKGESFDHGISRFEWEKEISNEDALALMKLCEPGVIDKIRYEIEVGNHVFEVDEFFGDNEGLTVAEIELKHVSEEFEKPNWLGDEVTGNTKYYNSQLCKVPFKSWIT